MILPVLPMKFEPSNVFFFFFSKKAAPVLIISFKKLEQLFTKQFASHFGHQHWCKIQAEIVTDTWLQIFLLASAAFWKKCIIILWTQSLSTPQTGLADTGEMWIWHVASEDSLCLVSLLSAALWRWTQWVNEEISSTSSPLCWFWGCSEAHVFSGIIENENEGEMMLITVLYPPKQNPFWTGISLNKLTGRVLKSSVSEVN